MKWLPLLSAALRRKTARSIFTLASITVAFLLFGMMSGISARFEQLVENIPANRIMVTPRFGGRLPLAYVDQIARLDGVTRVAHSTPIFGYYQDEKHRLNVLMTDERFVAVSPELGVTPEQFSSLRAVQAGAIVSHSLAERYGWTVGNNFPIGSDIPKVDRTRVWAFTVVSIVPDVESFPDGFVIGNYAYLDEGRADRNKGTAFDFRLLVDDPNRTAEMSNVIENMFANSEVAVTALPERTIFENALQGAFDVEFFTRAVSAAALFMIVFLAGNVMAQSVRERIPEFAVMKTVGFADRAIFGLILAEAVIPCVLGACFGLALARTAPALGKLVLPESGIFPIITPTVVAYALAASILVALVSGLPAAWSIRRLNVVDALAGR